MSDAIRRIEEMMALAREREPYLLMRGHETLAGRLIIVPGEVSWFAVSEWHPNSVVSIDRRSVRLIALFALHPGQGAFRRLVAAILALGLEPQVIEPTIELEKTLDRWGWERHEIGWGLEREVVWLPGREQGECEKCG